MKPSPVPSILLFIATAALLFSLFGRGWNTHVDEHIAVHSGPVWGEVCFDSGDGMECKTHTFLSDLGKGSMGPGRIFGLLFVLLGVGGTIVAGIAAILLLSRPRTATALVTVILVGGSAVIMLGLFVYGVSQGGRFEVPGYGFFLFFIGAILAVVGGFLGMSSSRGGAAQAPMRPGYPYGGPPPGYPAQPGYGGPPGYPQPHQMQQPMPQPVHAQPPQAGPAHTCGTSMTWVVQYNRWYCPRCNQYS